MNLADIPKEKLSPMMQQYAATKEKYNDCILFFRLGDFYEMFFEDAILVSRELELTLTGKECGLEERAPMCGVPYHSVELYLKRLVDKGYKIAICEQMTDPALSKGLVERDVIRIVTPGTLIESSMLDDDSNNYICTLYYGNDGSCALCFADLSTGEMSLTIPQEADPRIPQTVEVFSTEDRSVQYAMLACGYVDAIAAHETAILQYMKDNSVEFRILEEPLLVTGLGIAFAKNDSRGLDIQLNAVLAQMRTDGTLEQILGKYLEHPSQYLEVDTIGA